MLLSWKVSWNGLTHLSGKKLYICIKTELSYNMKGGPLFIIQSLTVACSDSKDSFVIACLK